MQLPEDDGAAAHDGAADDNTMIENTAESTAPPAEKSKETATNADKNKSVAAILGLKMDVRIVLGRSKMPIGELLELTKGSVIELDRKVGEPVDVMINDRTVARGDLVRVKDDQLGVALREIIKDISFEE